MGKATIAPSSDDKWKTEDALRSLTSAEEVRADKDLHAKATALAAEKAAQMQRVAASADNLAKRGLISDEERSRMPKKKKIGKKPMMKPKDE